jgi:putative ABC transport system substrate-binding protein
MGRQKFLSIRFVRSAFLVFPVFIAVHSLLFFPAAGGQQAEAFEIAVVKDKDIPAYDQALKGFSQTLDKQGIPAGLKFYDPGNREITREIADQVPALILTVGTTATKLISDEINGIPLVFSMIMDPVGSSVTSRDIAGASLDIPPGTYLQTLAGVLPNHRRVGVVYSLLDSESYVRQAKRDAGELGLTLKAFPVRSTGEVPGVTDLDIDVLWIIPDTVVCKPAIIRRLLLASLKSRTPVMGFSRSYARAGALLAVSCDYEDIGRQSGELAARILKGEEIQPTKITRPRKIKLFLNKTVADRLGITIPDKITRKASEVF